MTHRFLGRKIGKVSKQIVFGGRLLDMLNGLAPLPPVVK